MTSGMQLLLLHKEIVEESPQSYLTLQQQQVIHNQPDNKLQITSLPQCSKQEPGNKKPTLTGVTTNADILANSVILKILDAHTKVNAENVNHKNNK